MVQELARNGLEPLLHRELQVLAGVRSGLSNRQIGEQIHVCEDTVKYHLKRIFLKLDVSRRSEAVAVAVYNGLLDGFDRNRVATEPNGVELNGLEPAPQASC